MEVDPRPLIASRLKEQQERLSVAARACGRDPASVTLIAVSKYQSTSAIRAAYDAGQRDFGENYIQELVTKASLLRDLPGIRWHMIGHVQTNKCRFLPDTAHRVHTIDSVRLAQELGRKMIQHRRTVAASPGAAKALSDRPVPFEQSPSSARVLDVLVEVNVSGEQSKSGCAPEELDHVLRAIDEQPLLRAVGLMTMPPAQEDPEGSAPYFERLVELREAHGGAARLPELSFGMSGDADVAVRKGATCVRIGTAIFGPREVAP